MFLDRDPMRFKIVLTPICFCFLVLTGCKSSSDKVRFFRWFLWRSNKQMAKGMVLEFTDGSMDPPMKDIIWMTRHGHGRFLWANGEVTKEIISRTGALAKELTHGPMVLFTRWIFVRQETRQGLYQSWMAQFMRVNGLMTYNMVIHWATLMVV